MQNSKLPSCSIPLHSVLYYNSAFRNVHIKYYVVDATSILLFSRFYKMKTMMAHKYGKFAQNRIHTNIHTYVCMQKECMYVCSVHPFAIACTYKWKPAEVPVS